MKFVCDQCGKKYATAENPAPGKVYKLKCKACGHLIVVKGQAGTTTGIPAVTSTDQPAVARPAPPSPAAKPPPPALTPLPTETPPPGSAAEASSPRLPPPSAPSAGLEPEIELQVEPPAPAPALEPLADPWAAAAPPPEPFSARAEPPPAPPLPPEVADAVDFAAASAASAAMPDVPRPVDPALAPPPADKDELADFAAAAAAVIAAPVEGETAARPESGFIDPFADSTDQKELPRSDDPFLAASRASLPDGYAGPGFNGGSRSPPEGERTEPAAPSAQLPRAPAGQGRSRAPMAIIGVGMAVLVAITGWALFGSTKKESPPAPVAQATPTPVTTPAPPIPPPAEPKPEPPVVAKVEPEPAPAVAQKAPEPKARPPERKPERKPEARVEPKAQARAEAARPPPAVAPPPAPAPAAAPEPAPEAREPELPDAATALTPDVVNRVVSANRKAFSSCIASAAASEVTLDGRKVALRITVNTNGTVTYPTLDDQSLNGTEMGQCLKSAARLMIFPRFKGDPFHYEVPLVLTGN